MTKDKKKNVIFDDGGHIITFEESRNTNTPMIDFHLDGNPYIMVTVADKVYFSFFCTPLLNHLTPVLDYLNKEFGGKEVDFTEVNNL